MCRQHAIALALELEGRSGSAIGDAIDRIMGGRDPFAAVVGAIKRGLDGVLTDRARAQQPEPPHSSSRHSPPPPQPRSPPRPPPPPPQPKPNPTARARELMGFEPNEPLTSERIHTRKQALARVFHPDRPGGSLAQMQRVNDAADTLLANLR